MSTEGMNGAFGDVCHTPLELSRAPSPQPDRIDSFTTMTSDEVVTDAMLTQGWAHLGTLQLSDDTRLSATRYSQEQYKTKYLDGPTKSLRMFPGYHCKEKEAELGGTLEARRSLLDVRGTMEERDEYLRLVWEHAINLSRNSHDPRLKEWIRESQPAENLPKNSSLREVALGYRYDKSMLNTAASNGKNHYVRGFYYAGGHSDVGVVSGSSKLDDSDRPSTPEDPIIDGAIRDNFRTAGLPGEGINMKKGQQGVLWLTPEFLSQDPDNPMDQIWTITYNDSFYLGGVHYQRPVCLASPRTEKNMYRGVSNVGTRIFGREYALVMGSEAYELHSSKELGETLIYSGAPEDGAFGIPEFPELFKKYSEDPAHRASLVWLNDSSNLNTGDVVVQTVEKKVGDTWICTRDLNAMPEEHFFDSLES